MFKNNASSMPRGSLKHRAPFSAALAVLTRSMPYTNGIQLCCSADRASFSNSSSASRFVKARGKKGRKEVEGAEDLEDGEYFEDDFEDDEFLDDLDSDQMFDSAGVIDTAKQDWAEAALKCAQAALQNEKLESEIQLYSFRVNVRTFQVYVRLDKLEDKYGSPTLEEIRIVSRDFNNRMEEEQIPHWEDIAVEVSTPGAERDVQVPDQLMRFKGLPMRVVYRPDPDDIDSEQVGIMDLQLVEDEVSTWRLADVRANRPDGKGRKLSKKKLTTDIPIPVSNILKCNLHIDL
ncbi:hypothetical protein CYMTET_50526 [Cymbomonas tetramitiformis]|uniref:DUF7912 domain-containing protein n=1 Tax=Cymbomonas tetramitiformis TaxID=36881 RepID=A0AAE0BPL9_9CHLO|nr:hypothetical protein CYMTET_50526 [Cymbomonas tetramitiformis]